MILKIKNPKKAWSIENHTLKSIDWLIVSYDSTNKQK